jgi:hypothetical protein
VSYECLPKQEFGVVENGIFGSGLTAVYMYYENAWQGRRSVLFKKEC